MTAATSVLALRRGDEDVQGLDEPFGDLAFVVHLVEAEHGPEYAVDLERRPFQRLPGLRAGREAQMLAAPGKEALRVQGRCRCTRRGGGSVLLAHGRRVR